MRKKCLFVGKFVVSAGYFLHKFDVYIKYMGKSVSHFVSRVMLLGTLGR